MARNGSGTYSLVSGNPVVTGTSVSSTWANNTLSDIASALTASIAADGQTPITANLPMNNHKITGLSAGTTAGDSLMYGQALNGSTGTFSGAVTAASFSGIGASLSVTKSANTSRSSNTTLADDPHLVLAIPVGTWQVESYIPIWTTTSGAGGAKYAFAFSGTATAQFGSWGSIANTLTVLQTRSLAETVTAASISSASGLPTIDYIRFTGLLIVSITGNLSFQWAQNSSNSNALNLPAGAWLTCTKVA